MNVRHAAELTLVLGRTLGENVTLRGVGALDRAAGARLETLGGGALVMKTESSERRPLG